MHTRADFKKIPLRFLVTPSLNGPVIRRRWNEPFVFVDVDGREKLAWPKYHELRVAMPRRPRTGDAHALALYEVKMSRWVKEFRRIWSQMVDQADCFFFPKDKLHGVQCYFEFEPDA